MMRPEAAEPPEKAAYVKDPDVRDFFENFKKLWGALRHEDHHVSDNNDIFTAQMALLCTHYLSAWGQVIASSLPFLFVLNLHPKGP